MSTLAEGAPGTLALPRKNLIEGTTLSQSSGRLNGRGLRELRTVVVEKLSSYPYFALVRNFPGVENSKDLTRVVKEFGAFSRTFSLRNFLRRLRSSGPVTEIKIVPGFDMEGTYARTSRALEPHTDASFHAHPFELVVLYCIESDGAGAWTSSRTSRRRQAVPGLVHRGWLHSGGSSDRRRHVPVGALGRP